MDEEFRSGLSCVILSQDLSNSCIWDVVQSCCYWKALLRLKHLLPRLRTHVTPGIKPGFLSSSWHKLSASRGKNENHFVFYDLASEVMPHDFLQHLSVLHRSALCNVTAQKGLFKGTHKRTKSRRQRSLGAKWEPNQHSLPSDLQR